MRAHARTQGDGKPGKHPLPDDWYPRAESFELAAGNPHIAALGETTGALFSSETSLPKTPIRKAAGPTGHLHAEFDQWWSWVPKKVEKTEASRLFRQARTKKHVPFENLLASMMAYAQQFTPFGAHDPQYSTGPARWLRNERWNDESPAPWKPDQQRSQHDIIRDELGGLSFLTPDFEPETSSLPLEEDV